MAVNDIVPSKARLDYVFQTNDRKCLLCDENVNNIYHNFIKCPLSNKLGISSNDS